MEQTLEDVYGKMHTRPSTNSMVSLGVSTATSDRAPAAAAVPPPRGTHATAGGQARTQEMQVKRNDFGNF